MKKLEERRTRKVAERRKSHALEGRQRQFNALPEADLAALTKAWQSVDVNNKGWLTMLEVVAALHEMGLRGTNTAEKREIVRCTEELMALFQRTESACLSEVEEEPPEEETVIDLIFFALHVVPRIRQRLTEMQSDEMLRQFLVFDRAGTGKLQPTQLMEISRAMGLDQRMIFKDFESRCGDEGVSFDDFEAMVSRSREELQRVVKLRERSIRQSTGISADLFNEFRQDVVNLYDIYMRHDVDGDGTLGYMEITLVLREFGLLPKTARERTEVQNLLKASDEDGNGEWSFGEFLELARRVRKWHQDRKEDELRDRFEKYDKDHTGTLCVEEISQLLIDVGSAPRTRKEQEELAQLIAVVDEDGNGNVDFHEFQVLTQRIQEKLNSTRYEQEVEYALSLGFTAAQLRDLRWVFDTLDANGSERLDAQEVRAGLAMMNLHVSSQSFDNAFSQLDVDRSGELDFKEFLDFMQLMRDGEGIFSDDSQKLPTKVKFVDIVVLRSVLECFSLARYYLISLAKEELVDLFCKLMGVTPTSNIHEELGINSVGQLFEIAKKRAAAIKS